MFSQTHTNSIKCWECTWSTSAASLGDFVHSAVQNPTAFLQHVRRPDMSLKTQTACLSLKRNLPLCSCQHFTLFNIAFATFENENMETKAELNVSWNRIMELDWKGLCGRGAAADTPSRRRRRRPSRERQACGVRNLRNNIVPNRAIIVEVTEVRESNGGTQRVVQAGQTSFTPLIYSWHLPP